MNVLVTGCAGFVGSNLADELLRQNYKVIGVDNFNDYYDPKIKEVNLQKALRNNDFKLYREDILDFDKLNKIFKKEKIEKVVHLAGRAGIRPSIKNPLLYSQTNVLGTVNLLKLSVNYKVQQFIFGSSSSVYGNSKKLPFSEDDPCEDIISPYGASKRAAEFWVESFFHSFGLKSTILRFFTVYGPRGRPDMAPALFTNAILNSDSIIQYGDGSSSRDYTYIGDIVSGIIKSLEVERDFDVFNLGNNHPVSLVRFIKAVKNAVGKKAIVEKAGNQLGDVQKTWADIKKAKTMLDWNPRIRLEEGLVKTAAYLKSKMGRALFGKADF